MVFAAVGWHPGQAVEAPQDVRPELRDLADHPKVIAIGECGMDFFRATEPGSADRMELEKIQERVFRQQLEVAAEKGLNCVIHQRAAWNSTMAIWDEHRTNVRGMFHCFVGTPEEARQVLDRGGLVSFTGIVTFKNADTVRQTLASLGPGQFCLETDCPYLAPAPNRGKRSEPAHVADIATHMAGVLGWSIEKIGQETCAAAHAFFPKLVAPSA